MELKIRKFGPINEGYNHNNGFMSFPRVTMFCGPQGSGKSTITKVASSMIWLEKAAYVIGWAREIGVSFGKDFLMDLLAWHGLSSYFRSGTEISYRGDYLEMDFAENNLMIRTRSLSASAYSKPKIMYIPAERNFLHIIAKESKLPSFFPSLSVLYKEFEKAKTWITSPYKLPINGYDFALDKETGDYYVVNRSVDNTGKSSRTPVQFSSSGIQSILPMLLITDYLYDSVESKLTRQGLDIESQSIGGNPFYKVAENNTAKYIDNDSGVLLDAFFSRIASPCSNFINIVEEPEQNLFPPTQRLALRRLLSVVNSSTDNKLVLSTHSPYVVWDIIASTMARSIVDAIKAKEDEKGLFCSYLEEVDKLYDKKSRLNIKEVQMYETSHDGTICNVEEKNGYFSDKNFLNYHLRLGHNLLEALFELKQLVKRASF